MKLRPYQQEAFDAVRSAFKAGHKKLLVVLPTGSGKTILFAKMAERFWQHRNERTLIISHREELVLQAVSKINTATSLNAQIEKGNVHADKDCPIVSASVQTMQGKRLQQWDADHFGLIVCDECHHLAAKTWQNILSHFAGRVLGVTATPTREDHLSLKDCFDHLAYQCPLAELIHNKFLCDIHIKSVPLQIDLSAVKVKAGDLRDTDISDALAPFMEEIINHIDRLASDRKKIIIFLPLIATSKSVCEMFNARGIKALHVDGQSKDRAAILEDFGAGDARVLCNAMLLTEGYDEPCIDCVVILRPTKSRALYAQMVGRGTRLFQGKENLLLLDFLYEHNKHNLARPWSLVAKDEFEEEMIKGYREQNEQSEIDLLELQEKVRELREQGLASQLANGGKKFPLSESLLSMARITGSDALAKFQPACQWDIEKPNKDQAKFLKDKGAKLPRTQGEAEAMMNTIFQRQNDGLATYKQLKQLHRLNTPNAPQITFQDATRIMASHFCRR